MIKDFTVEIKNSLEALIKLENNATGKKELFDKDKNICLKISIFHIPKVRGIKKKYLKLHHSRFGDEPEVCLFVPNRKSDFTYKISTDDSIDITVDYYQSFLEKHKVRGIKTIMPLKQLECEYGAFEMRRKLVDRFDLFLCKMSLLHNPRFIKALGKYFIKKNKEPIGLTFPKWDNPLDENFNCKIMDAILTTTLKIKPYSDNYAIPIGKLSHSKEKLAENIHLVIKQLYESDIIPGGFNNIKGLYLGTSSTGAVPLYICMDFPENLIVPKVKSGKKTNKTVQGRITSLPGKKVFVTPSGKVIVKKIKNYKKRHNFYPKDKSENYFEDMDEDGMEKEEENEKEIFEVDEEDIEKEGSDVSSNKSDTESDEDDDEIERKEMKLLRQSELLKEKSFKTKREILDEKYVEAPPKKKLKKMVKTPKKKNVKINKFEK